MRAFALFGFLLFLTPLANADDAVYQKPPPEVEAVLEAKLPPVPYPSPAHDAIVFAQPVRYPAVAILAEPMLRLGGLRINTLTNGMSDYPIYSNELSLKTLPDGAVRKIKTPPDARIGHPMWNATGTAFMFANETRKGTELWVVDTKTLKAHKIPGVKLNTLFGYWGFWMPDHRTVLTRIIPAKRGPAPATLLAPKGPVIEESTGVKTASSTYETKDVLKNAHDADLFDYYTTSQMALINTRTNKVKLIGKPGIYASSQPSPDAKHILIEQLHRPYSYKRTYERFPRKVQIWSINGKLEESLADRPLADAVPIRGVATGPRDHTWIYSQPATVMWVEAMDDGNPKNKVPHRDRLLSKLIGQEPHEMFQIEQRFGGIEFIEGGTALVHDWDDEKQWVHTYLTDLKDPSAKLQVIDSRSMDDHYGDPGRAVYRVEPSEIMLVRRDGDWIYRSSQMGASPDGDRPFWDRFNLKTLQSERLFRSDKDHLERMVAIIDPVKGIFVTRRESPTEPPNLYWRTLDPKPLENVEKGEPQFNSSMRAITHFPDPTPQIRGITKQLVNYERGDGVKLSFMLYLPPGYKKGTKLPTVFYAYPLDYTDEKVAGQVKGSTKNFVTLAGTSHLFFLMRGYAVLDNVSMPIVGPTATAYDTYLEQLVADAKLAIQKAVDMGVTDPDRVGVLGHSHGALMTANLLAHSDLFKAGIARSGSYNKTLTMFGFQNERRPLFDARDVYYKVSPTLHAEKIKSPLLLIHGEIDSNPGTVPLQSQMLFEAIRGTGGTARLVMLPYENHGYLAKESTEQVLYEMIRWFDKYVKGDDKKTMN